MVWPEDIRVIEEPGQDPTKFHYIHTLSTRDFSSEFTKRINRLLKDGIVPLKDASAAEQGGGDNATN